MIERIKLLPHWCITDKQPAFYDTESATAIEQTAKLYAAMRNLQEDYNKYVDEVNKVIEEFINTSNADQEEFKNKITTIMHNYIEMIDEKVKMQDDDIKNAVSYMEKNIVETTTTIINQLVDENKIKINRLEELYINVRDYGAVGDGVTDDTVAIQTAINQGITLKSNIFIPSGTYLISNELILQDSIKIKGESNQKTIIKIVDNTKNGVIVDKPYTQIEDICFECPTDYTNKSAIVVTCSTGHTWNQFIENCIFKGTDHTGYGILIQPNYNFTYGLMNTIIEKCLFRGLNSGIYFDITKAWANGGIIKDCWVYDCVYGIDFKTDGNIISNWSISNFRGQYHSNVSIALINNLMGVSVTLDDCILWDGGKTLIIHNKSKYTIIKNISVNLNKLDDFGYCTKIINYGEQENGTYYELEDKFYGNDLDAKWNKVLLDGASISTIIKNNSGSKSPAVELSTGAVVDNYAKLNFGNKCLFNEYTRNYMNFKFCVDSIENVEIHMGLHISGNVLEGNYLRMNTANDNKLYGIAQHYDTESSLLIKETLEANKWYDVQILYENDTKVHFWLDGVYIGELSPQRYDSQPYFYIKTLDGTAKKLYIANLLCRHYIY